MAKSNKIRQTATETVDGRKLAYALWIVSATKSPRTKSEWAAEHEVNRDTLYEWERSDWMSAFIDKDSQDKKAAWALAFSELEWLTAQRQDLGAKASAIREMGKLMGKYPSEKVDVTSRMGLLEWLGSTQEARPDKRAN